MRRVFSSTSSTTTPRAPLCDEETAVAERPHDEARLGRLVERDLSADEGDDAQPPREAGRRVAVGLLRRHGRPAPGRRERRVHELLAAVEARELLHRERRLETDRQNARLDLRLLRRDDHRDAALVVDAEPIVRSRGPRQHARRRREVRRHDEQLVLRADLVDGAGGTTKEHVSPVGREARIVRGLLGQALLHVPAVVGEVEPVTGVEGDGAALRRPRHATARSEGEGLGDACIAHEIVGEGRRRKAAHELRDLVRPAPDRGLRELAELGERILGEDSSAVDVHDARLQSGTRLTVEATKERTLSVAGEPLEVPVAGIRLGRRRARRRRPPAQRSSGRAWAP